MLQGVKGEKQGDDLDFVIVQVRSDEGLDGDGTGEAGEKCLDPGFSNFFSFTPSKGTHFVLNMSMALGWVLEAIEFPLLPSLFSLNSPAI